MKTQPRPDLVRRLRLVAGWSQEELASQSRVGVSTVQRIESGKPIRASTLSAIARALGVTLAELRVDEPVDKERVEGLPGPARILGPYGPLLAALVDARKEVLHWRRAFLDTFTYRGFFMRTDGEEIAVQLQKAAPLASTISLTLHRDVSELLLILKKLRGEIEGIGGALRGHASRGHRLSPAANAEILKIGTVLCDGAEFHLIRAERELRTTLRLDRSD